MKKPIADWVREVLTDSNYGNIAAILLSHDPGFGTGKEVDNVVFGGDKQWDPIELEKRFLGKCENYCGNTTGRHAFKLDAIYDSSASPRNTLNFHYDVLADEGRGIGLEPPTKDGIVQQCMRHTEVMFKQASDSITSLTNTMTRMMEMMNDRANHAELENRDAWNIIRDMGNRLMDKRQEHRLEELRFQRNSQTMSTWMRFGPALINQILGKEVFPQGIADTAMVEAIAENLDEEAITVLSQKLKPELWGVFANRITNVLENKKAEIERDNRLLAHNLDGEANASGDKIVKSEIIQ